VSRRIVVVLVAWFAAGITSQPAVAQNAQSWLARMSHAVEELTYQGTFLHMQGGDAETLQITHLNDDGRVSERILALDGVAREIIRYEDKTRCSAFCRIVRPCCWKNGGT